MSHCLAISNHITGLNPDAYYSSLYKDLITGERVLRHARGETSEVRSASEGPGSLAFITHLPAHLQASLGYPLGTFGSSE